MSPSPSVSASSSEDELDEDSGSSQLADDSPSSSSPETPARISHGLCRFPLTSFTGSLPSLRQTGLLSRHLSHSQTSNISSFISTNFNDHSYVPFDDDLDFDITSYPQNQLGEDSDSPIYHMDLPSENDEGRGHCGRNRREDKDDLASESDMQISRGNSPALPSPGPVIIGAWPGSPAPVSDDEEIVSSAADVDTVKALATPGAEVLVTSTVQAFIPDVIDVDALPTPNEREVIWIEDDVSYPIIEAQSFARYASPFVSSAIDPHWARNPNPPLADVVSSESIVPVIDAVREEIIIEAPQAVRPIDPVQVGFMNDDAHELSYPTIFVPSSSEAAETSNDQDETGSCPPIADTRLEIAAVDSQEVS